MLDSGLRLLRAELGLTQTELAIALHTSFSTVNRWENGKSKPSKTARYRILEFAQTQGVSEGCIEKLRAFISPLLYDAGGAQSVDESLICQLVDETDTAVYVADFETDELLFTNRASEALMGARPGGQAGKRCYEYLMHRDSPCPFCQKTQLSRERLQESSVELPTNGRQYTIQSKLLVWGGRLAHAHFMTDETNLLRRQAVLNDLTNRIPAGVGIYHVYPDGRIEQTYMNDGYYAMMGTDREKRARYHGFSILQAIHPEDARRLKVEVMSAIAEMRQINEEIRVHREDGGYQWVSIRANIIEKTPERSTLYCTYSDIDQLKNTQQELESNRTLLDAALASAKVMAWRYDWRNHRITDSGSFGTTFHLPKVINDVPNCIIQSHLVHPDSLGTFTELFEHLHEGKTIRGDIVAIAPDQSGYAWQRLIFTPVFEPDGQFLEYIGTAIDISEQKEREHIYEEQLETKKALARNEISVALLNLTRNRVSDLESTDPDIFATSDGETVDEIFRAACGNFNVDSERIQYAEIFNRQTMLEQYELGITHNSLRHHTIDQRGWLESSYDMMENPYTGDIEAMIVVRDVSELVRAEQVVNTLMRIDYDSIMTIDGETGAFTRFMSDRMDAVLEKQGRRADDANGLAAYLRKYCADPDVERVVRETSLPYIKERLSRAPVYTTAYSLRLGEEIVHKRMICAYLNDLHKTILCAMQDLTETYQQEEWQKQRLAEALNAAEQASIAKTDFFSRMSHDMRTPMNGILGLAELSSEETDIQVLQHNISKIKESGQYLLGLINDTLDFQRIESGRLTLEPEIVNMREFFNSIVDLVKIPAEEKGIDFRVITRNVDLSAYIKIDPVRMKQIFFNLLSNAVKFTPNGGTVTFEFERMEQKGMIAHDRVRVRDTGIGMSQDFLDHHIFKPFSQEYSQVTSQYAGSGLGLSIVHRLVELMGGTIQVESEQGTGTTFTLLLDFERVDKQTVSADSISGRRTQGLVKHQLDGKQILLVEDHPLNAEIAKKLLERAGCVVTWAENGQIGVDLFAQGGVHAFDAVLMDIRMPVMNGLEAARAIRAMERPDAQTTPILAMTANAYEEDVRKSLDAGMNAHLAKPIEPMKLYETLAQYLMDAAE